MSSINNSPSNVPSRSSRRYVLAGAGLALVGAGVSVAMDAGLRRQAGAQTTAWVGQGTLGLSVMCAGLSIFGEAVALRALEMLDER